MEESTKQRVSIKKVGNYHTLRIRGTIKSCNVSPQQKQFSPYETHYSKKWQNKVDIKTLLKKVPKTIQLKDNLLVEGCFSYVDEGFEKWKIGKTIGKGNSCVRKAMNVKTGIISAVKQIIFNSQDQEKQRLNQISILTKINHPNIVSCLQHYKIKNQTWIFMEYIPTNLKIFYTDFGPPPTKTFIKFAKQIISAIAYLQKINIMHKDIKCENILVSNFGILKLCDFGSSRHFSNTMSLKNYQKNLAIKTFKGSFLWSAPESLTGSACLASDIWSLGCTLVELASGRLPWHEQQFDNEFQAIKFIVEEEQIPRIQQNWDHKVKYIISKCLERIPSKRITAVELLEQHDLWNDL